MSTAVTLALLTLTLPPLTVMRTDAPCTVGTLRPCSFDDIGRQELTTDDVVRQDADELCFVGRFEQGVDRASGQLSESGVGWRENRERPSALERADQIGGTDGCDERREVGVARGDIDNRSGGTLGDDAGHQQNSESSGGEEFFHGYFFRFAV